MSLMATVCTVCGGDLVLRDETFDAIYRVFVGRLDCSKCGDTYIDQRKRSETRPGGMMAKKAKPKKEKPAHRVNTVKSDGSPPESREVAPAEVPIGEAMREAVEQLGDVVIDDQLAPGQLRELAECYETVAEAQAAYDRKAAAAKVAKQSLDGAIKFLLEKVKEFTHAKPLPLFDQQQAEADRAAMTGAATEGEAAPA